MTMLLLLTWATHLGYDLVYDMGGVHVLYLATYVPMIALAVEAAQIDVAGDLPGHDELRIELITKR